MHPIPEDPRLPFIPITATSIATPGNGNVSWTTVSVAAYVPSGNRVAILRVSLGGCTTSGSFVTNQIDFRKDSTQEMIASVAVKMAQTGTGGTVCSGVIETVLVPLTGSRTFDYQKTDTIANSSGGTVEIIGYY